MEKNLSATLKPLVAAAWRRRILLLVPMLVLLPLGLLGAKFLPRTYISTALIVMQESDRDNPFLKKNGGIDYTLVKRVAGLEAWLKSEHILTQILRPFSKTDPEKNPVGFLLEIEDFRKSFRLELIGNDFLRFSLKDSNPVGLGTKLEALTSKFLEGLLIPDQSVQNASQAVLGFHRKKLQGIRDQQAGLKRDSQSVSSSSKTSLVSIQEKQDLLKKLRALYAQNRQAAKLVTSPDDQGFRTVNVTSGNGNGTIIQQQKNRLSGLANRIRDLEQEITLQKADNTEIDTFEKRWLDLKNQEKSARLHLEKISQRLTDANAENPLGILNAPEGIKIIDAPKDPVRPATSGLLIFLAGVYGAIFIGISLAVLAEITDQRIYTAAEIAELAGASVIGALPDTDNNRSGKGERSGAMDTLVPT